MSAKRVGIGFLTFTCLGACGGGGGGSSPALSPVTPLPPVYTTITATGAQWGGNSVAYQSAAGNLSDVPGSVKGGLSWNSGNIVSIQLEPSVSSAALFTETFAGPLTQPLEIAPGTTVQLYVATKTASDGSVRSVALLDPVSAGLSYMTLGAWGYVAPPPSGTEHGGRFAIGSETRGRDIPTTGSANYKGLMLGTFADGTTLYSVSASANAQADFAARRVTLSTQDTRRTAIAGAIPVAGATPVADPSLNLSGAMTYPAGTNALTGTLSAGTLSGSANAKFFGPAAAELGGAYFLKDSTDSKQMGGAFSLRKQ